jgi:thioredoxin reductase (NADPH)
MHRPGVPDDSARLAAPPALVDVDCAVVGGGPAGLSAAVNLGRMRRSVLVIDDRDGRSLWGQINRNYLGFPDGLAAAEFRRQGRRQAARYGARFMRGRAVSARRRGELFVLGVEGGAGEGAGTAENVAREDELSRSLGDMDAAAAPGPAEVVARTLILATGVRDAFPEFPGWTECVGRSLFWCINCDGHETIGRRVVVVGHDEDAVATALELLDFTDRVILVAGRREGFGVPASRLADLARSGIATHACRVAEYVNAGGQISALVLDDAAPTRLAIEVVFAYRRPVARTEIARDLGASLDTIGQIVVDSAGQTNVPGLYAAGDVTSPHNHQVSAAVHEGREAAGAANYYLYRPVQKGPTAGG